MFEGDDFTYTNPLDAMPIATNGSNRYASPDRLAELELEVKSMKNPRPEEEIADLYASRHESTPEFEKTAEEVVTMHEKMYRIATAKYNPFLHQLVRSLHTSHVLFACHYSSFSNHEL